jgi:hypothetical protein
MKAVEIYTHLEHNTVDERTREAGESWYERMMKKADVISRDFRANSGRDKIGNDK